MVGDSADTIVIKGRLVFVLASLLALLVPFYPVGSSSPASDEAVFPGWPTEWEGRSLTALTLTSRELRFSQDFPGQIGRFTDGDRHYILRWTTQPTRRLHPATDCFRASGYTITSRTLVLDGEGRRWLRFHATRAEDRIRVTERVYDDSGNSWTDVSAWYWAAVLKKTKGPWWAVTVMERISSMHVSEEKVGDHRLSQSKTPDGP